ncbi:MAG TPA: YggS family pyridoxal phosphate-dependent enzyme [Anaerolineales bacterium]|nr:YggS family pyridoxal phosphate-dependent enzyme [Anaerolineales bacterium]
MTDLTETIRERYVRVVDAMAAAARKAGRRADAVRLVVVTKTQPVEIVRAVIEAGAHVLGENYAEEAAEKIAKLGSQSGVEWHMIGHIQSRKAELVAQHFDLVHSLDSLRLAERLNRSAAEAGRSLAVLLEFNVSGEASKHGWNAADESQWTGLLEDVRAVAVLTNLTIRGLMTMPPLSTDPESARMHFRRLGRLREFLAREVPGAEWQELSMGTSADFGVAVEEGATLVRVGQAIVGPRPYPEAD